MNDVIPNNTRYVPLTQQPYCCVPTCIQMIMLRHKIPLQPAEFMAYHMKIVVSPEKKSLFWNLPSVDKRPESGYGTSVSEELTLNSVFETLDIPLKGNFELIDAFTDAEHFWGYIQKSIKNDNDVILCYDYGTLFKTGKHSGHTSVLDNCDTIHGTIQFIDPESISPKWRVVSYEKMFESMRAHGKRFMAGCWEIKKS